ncbi:hypothetical protein EOL70_16395 [Leucothrix sargassi]|nr:hypothetical protein EOL70_16395 [Leucothrix sargassi]
MSVDALLLKRGNSQCEFCGSPEGLATYDVPPITLKSLDKSVLVCSTCLDQIENPDKMQPNHWRCLNDTMWSETAAIQVMSWRLLNRLKGEGWPEELLEMMYMEDDIKKWAMADQRVVDGPTLDSNGVALGVGDTVIMIKDVFITGMNITAKRGMVVKNVSLTDTDRSIEGNLNGTRVVLGAKTVKKV